MQGYGPWHAVGTNVGWATGHILRLQRGHTVTFRPRGNSMRGKISSGQRVTVEPLGDRVLQVDDIVLCEVKGHQYLHLVKGVDPQGRVLIGNNLGGINGVTPREKVYGICTKVES